jgi:hypothetical protein
MPLRRTDMPHSGHRLPEAPLSRAEAKKAFVLLELMNHMVLVAKAVKSRGYDVVALNHGPLRTDGPFAVPDGLVDEVVPVRSWSDPGPVRELLADVSARYEVVGTYTGFEAPLPFEAELRELAGLPNNGSDNVRRVLDKLTVRRTLYRQGLSRLRSASLTEALAWDRWEFSRPAVLKPTHGTGSALCRFVSSREDLHAAADEVASGGVVNPLMNDYIRSHGEFVLEEQAEGELLSVESLVYRGRVHVIGLMGRYVLADDPVVEQGFLFPYHHPRLAEITARAEEFHHALGVVHGPTQIEVMVPDDGPVELVDFNVRLAGTASVVCFSRAYGVDYPSLLADVACGVEPDLSFLDEPHRYASEMLVLPPPGTTELRELAFPPEAECTRWAKEPGQRLTGRADQLDVVGMFVVVADSASEVHRKAIDARCRVVVNGEELGDNPNNHLACSPYIGADLVSAMASKGSQL